MTLRVLIADDELMARRRLLRLLADMPDVEVVAECASGDAVLAELDRTDVDVCLLDVQMPGMSGLDVAHAAADLGVEIVFTTAHPEHAVAAFDRGAVDYVLKPIDAERLALALSRARERVVVPAPARTAERLALQVRDEVVLIAPDDVSHAVLDGELVTVWTKGRAILTALSLSELEARLPQCVRVHRRALLNMASVERLRPLPTGGYLAVTKEGHEVPVSRQASRALRRRLGL